MTHSKATTIEATYRIVTPMFCSGADQKSAELRVPSFKGALRFWWRSLMWGRVSRVEDLQQKEAALFGASEQKTGQSLVRLRLSNESLEAPISPGEILERGRLLGLHYLGYGVMEAFDGKNTKAGRLRRAMIPGGQFTVSCRFSRFAETDQIDEVRRALILLGTVGGLGSKSRKGFGSLTLTSLTINGDEQQLPHSVQERLASVLYERQDGLPDWTAWSSSARVVVTTSEPSSRAIDALDALGREQVLFRSWGSNNRGKLPEHQTIEIPSEQNFAFDHDLFKKKVKGDYPHRVAFGLPHNYGKYDDQHVTTTTKTFGRRASPLLIHIDQAEVTSSAVVSKGGPDDLWNLQPLQWENNRGKSDNWPNWSCTRRAS